MPGKMRRDLTVEEQYARGPLDMPFLMLTVLLTGIGIIMVFSASYASAYYDPTVAKNDPFYYFSRQALFAVAGLAVMYLTSRINYQSFRLLSVFALLTAVLMLVLVFTPLGFGRETAGAQRWIKLGPINFQPSELGKLAVILMLSAGLSKLGTGKKKVYSKKTLGGRLKNLLRESGLLELLPYVLILGGVAGLVLIEPHLSGTILILITGAAIFFAAGVKLRWFAVGGAAAGAVLTYVMLGTSYMAKRLAIQQDPWSDPRGDGFQTIQSLYAVGSGGLLGVGLGNSRQKHLFLPEPENDYIFSIVCEELGFVGAAIIILLFVLLILRGYWIALHARDRFGALLTVGVVTLMAAQVFLNVAVVTNMIPPTGISLPFFSYGGTALLIQLFEMGIVLSVSRQILAKKQG